ncbi:MAG: STAS domain-containing protein [Azonexus sp.]|nr:STAS domain-containing protein [Betaproteobacteria bacterium]MBK8917841.1 STAS domain-containing protein [Betaproteobacteria bacterium]MBP6035928.1 STAS domain-containing protein [Azonexus sp.]MBP6906254.1 STAS domain-containing protein [Azonexus sp.]
MSEARIALLPVRVVAGVTVASPQGRIDHASAPRLDASLEPLLKGCRAGGPPLLLDLSGVEYISSMGLRVLVVASRTANAQGGKFAVAALQPLVQEVFSIARLNLMMPCYLDVDTGCAQLSA